MSPIRAAERALVEARAANLPIAVVEQMEAELASRRAAQQAQKPLPVQLQEATRRADEAKSALARAQERLAKVQAEVKAAQETNDKAAQNLREVTAVLSSTQGVVKQTAADPAQALAKLLEVVKAATAPAVGTDAQSAREALAQAVMAAEAVLPQHHAPPSLAHGEKRVADGAAASQSTEMGTQDVTQEEVDELLGQMESLEPDAKRKRLADLLAQGRAAGQSGTQLA